MKKIRIGNDISIVWKVAKLGFVDLDKNSIKAILTDSFGNVCNFDYTKVGDKIQGKYYGKDQYKIGYYTLTLYINKDEEGMSACDYVKAFALVKHSYQEEGTDAEGVTTEVVSVESTLSIGGGVTEEEIASQVSTKRVQINNESGEEVGHLDVTNSGTMELKSSNSKVAIFGNGVNIDSNSSSHFYTNGALNFQSLESTSMTATNGNIEFVSDVNHKISLAVNQSQTHFWLKSSLAELQAYEVKLRVPGGETNISMDGNNIKLRTSSKNSIAVQESDNRVNIVSPEIRWVEKKTTDTGVVDVEHLFSELFSNSASEAKYFVIPQDKITTQTFNEDKLRSADVDLRQKDNNVMALVHYRNYSYPPLRNLHVAFKENPMSDNGVRISQRVRFLTDYYATYIELRVGDTYIYSDMDEEEYDNDSLWKDGVRPNFEPNTYYDLIFEDGVFSFEKYK